MQGKARILGQVLPLMRAIDMKHERPDAAPGTEAGAQRALQHRPRLQDGLLRRVRRRRRIEQPWPIIGRTGRNLLVARTRGRRQERVKHGAGTSRIQADAPNSPDALHFGLRGRIFGNQRRWEKGRVCVHVRIKLGVGRAGLELRRPIEEGAAGSQAGNCGAWVSRLPYTNGPEPPRGRGPARARDDR